MCKSSINIRFFLYQVFFFFFCESKIITDTNQSSSLSPIMIVISEQKHLETLIIQYYEWMIMYYNINNNNIELSTKYQNVYNILVKEFPLNEHLHHTVVVNNEQKHKQQQQQHNDQELNNAIDNTTTTSLSLATTTTLPTILEQSSNNNICNDDITTTTNNNDEQQQKQQQEQHQNHYKEESDHMIDNNTKASTTTTTSTTTTKTISEGSNNNDCNGGDTTTTITKELPKKMSTMNGRKNTTASTILESYPELYRRFMGISDNKCQQCVLRQEQQIQKQQQQQQHKETRNGKKKKFVYALENDKFPTTFEKRYEILKKYYAYFGHCDVKIPDNDYINDHNDIDEYNIQVKLNAWIMSLRQMYQKIINKPNSMPLTSIRPYDITLPRLQLLNENYFYFKATYYDPLYHKDLYQQQNDIEKKLQNVVNNTESNITNKNKSITITTSIMKRNTTNSNNGRTNTASSKTTTTSSLYTSNSFCNDIRKWNASNEVKKVFEQLFRKQQQVNGNNNIPFNLPILLRDAGQKYNIQLEHYNIHKPNIAIATYPSLRNAVKITNIPRDRIRKIIRGEENPYDDDTIMGWRYVLLSSNINSLTNDKNNFHDDNKKTKT